MFIWYINKFSHNVNIYSIYDNTKLKMKKLLILLLLTSYLCKGQTIVDFALGEYSTARILSTGAAQCPKQLIYNVSYQTTNITGLETNVVQADGGQYHSVFLKSNGTVYDMYKHDCYSFSFPTDNLGNPFTATKVYAMWMQNMALKDDSIFYWSANNTEYPTERKDMLLQFGTVNTPIPKPRKLVQPTGKAVVDLWHGSNTYPYAAAKLWAYCSDSTMWQYDQTHTTPFQVTGKQGKALTWTGKITMAAMVGGTCNMVATSTNEFWVWGYNAGFFGGHADWENKDMDNVAPIMAAAGIVFPLKKLITNYLAAYVIDANDNMFSIGVNQSGLLGNGNMNISWRTSWNGTRSAVYAFDFDYTHGLQNTWVQVPGKFSNLKANTSFVFFMFAQDMNGNWYSTGRNKAKSLWNGFTYGSTDGGNYPEYQDNPAFRPVMSVASVNWLVSPSDGALDTAAIRTPLSNAGINQYLAAGTTSTTLYGSGSHQQQPDTGAITITMTNLWSRVSGPNTPTITSATSTNTGVTGMIAGTYVFKNVVTNNLGAKDSQTVSVVISSSGNISPIADAGTDQTITLPTSTVTLTGSGTDSDGTIVSYGWTKVSGPTGGTITSSSSATTGITVLQEGVYTFRLTVTDNLGATGTDDVSIIVNPATPSPATQFRGLFRF
jgi:hypothetical protein